MYWKFSNPTMWCVRGFWCPCAWCWCAHVSVFLGRKQLFPSKQHIPLFSGSTCGKEEKESSGRTSSLRVSRGSANRGRSMESGISPKQENIALVPQIQRSFSTSSSFCPEVLSPSSIGSLGSGHCLLLKQNQWTTTHQDATQNIASPSSTLPLCLLSVVADPCSPVAFRLRNQQQLSSNVGASHAVGSRRSKTEPPREEIARAGRPLGTQHGREGHNPRGQHGAPHTRRDGAHTLGGAGGPRACECFKKQTLSTSRHAPNHSNFSPLHSAISFKNQVIRFRSSATWQPGRPLCTFGCKLAERARNFARNFSGRTSRNGNGSSPRRTRGTAHRLSQQAQATCAQTRNSGSGSAQEPRRRATQDRSQQDQTTNAQRSNNWTGAKPKHETASSTGSNDSCPVLPRGSVATMATCSVGVRTEDSVNGSLSLWDWLTPAAATSTATQTLDDGRSLHQWRSIQGQYWLELQKVQHCIQSALNKRRDSGRSSGSHSHSPTAMLEQMQERLHSSVQDMSILNRSCGEEVVRSSLARARKAAPKKRCQVRRNRVRPVKQACSDTIEESISSTDEVAPQRKRASGLQRITTQLHHTHHVQHLLPP